MRMSLFILGREDFSGKERWRCPVILHGFLDLSEMGCKERQNVL